jgi:hypothetical protein
LPDEDLGKSITPGFRNLALTVSDKKIYVPSIYLPTDDDDDDVDDNDDGNDEDDNHDCCILLPPISHLTCIYHHHLTIIISLSSLSSLPHHLYIQDRAYGCPSIRSDIPRKPISTRSIADSQNYGDDVPAQDLINPPAFSDLSIDPLIMNQQYHKERLLSLFSRIGYSFDDDLGR